MNISSEVILGLVTAAGAVLTGGCAKAWLFFTGELKECKSERKELYARVDAMHTEIATIGAKVASLETQVEDGKP